MAVRACLVQVAVFLLLAGSATAQWDPATGLIKPTSGPPVYDPVPWNGAYKVTFKNVPISISTSGSPAWPRAPVRGVDTSQECSMDGFDTTLASAVDVVSTTWRPHSQGHMPGGQSGMQASRTYLDSCQAHMSGHNHHMRSTLILPEPLVLQDACFYKNNTDGTFDFWCKERTFAFSKANCYCYALDRFEGEPRVHNIRTTPYSNANAGQPQAVVQSTVYCTACCRHNHVGMFTTHVYMSTTSTGQEPHPLLHQGHHTFTKASSSSLLLQL